jgi:putative alpha-1,2-mannosidase
VKNQGKENRYVKNVIVNGKTMDGFHILHNDIINGGEIIFEMSNTY